MGKASSVGQVMGANLPPGEHGQAPRIACAKRELKNISGSESVIKKVLRFDGRALSSFDLGISESRTGTMRP